MCEVTVINGVRAIVCRRGSDRHKFKKCVTCGAPATLLCDEPVPDPYAYLQKANPTKTCDAPMCAQHAMEIGEDLHICWKHRQLREMAESRKTNEGR